MHVEVMPLIDGELTRSASDAMHEVLNPSTGKHLLSIPVGSAADADKAVASARRAFDDGRWSELPPSTRKRILHRLADLIEADAAALDLMDAEEMGKPISTPFANAAGAARLTRFYAEALDKVMGDAYCSDKGSYVTQRRVPRGVIAAIVPWNFPTYNSVLKFAPALAAGNCVVLKPSELSSRSAVRLGMMATEAGLPPGVLNVVPGLGESVGRALGLHMDVDMVAFTGSTTVGKLMLQYAGQSNLKVVVAECGGKSPQIVFADGVDLDAAAAAIGTNMLTNQGQICSVGSRLIVQREVESAMIDRIVSRFSKIVPGNAADAKTTFGPIASRTQYERVLGYIESARAEKIQLVTGGRSLLPESGGYFVEPTLFKNVAPTAKIAQEEIFGPVLSVIPFDTEEEALRIANGTRYGLMATVWTADLSRGLRMTRSIRSPVRVNAAPPSGEGAGHMSSFEPAGQSGVGVEGGLAGLESYQRRQLVAISYA
jgi:acyl-CoA reductase-like NAD-dependent aldehyde dehydrogenase